MSVRGSSSRKPLAFLTSLMVLFALVVPLIGTAIASHTNPGAATGLTLAVTQTTTAQAGGCAAVTVNVRQGSAVAEGETIDISVTMSDADTQTDLQIGFCDPDGNGGASDLSGPSPNPLSGQQTGSGGAPITDCDDANPASAGPVAGANACPNPPATFFEQSANIQEECFTNANGDCVFGVTSNEAGTAQVTVWYENCPAASGCVSNNARDANEPFNQGTVTFGAGGANAARNLVCSPVNDSNPDGTRHEFQCTVTDAAGTALPGITVSFDVTAGPNSEEIGAQNCGGGAAQPQGGGGLPGTTTNQQGQTATTAPEQATGGQSPNAGANQNAAACGYNDDSQGAANSLPGTDTIVAYVNQGTQPGGASPTAGPNTGEPQVTLTKIWTGAARTVDCEPEDQTVGVGGTGTINCTVRDNAGNPVQGVDVQLVQRSGPGANIVSAGCPGSGTPNCARTGSTGTVSFSVSQGQQGATGQATFRAQITAPGNAVANCQNTAGNPAGAPAGVCFDDVNVTWSQSTNTPPPQPQCNDGRDNDADGLVDFGSASTNDPGCSAIEDNTESPNPAPSVVNSASSVTYRYDANANAHKGQVASRRAICQRGRKVVVKEVGKGRVGSDRTNRAGNWKVRDRNAKGRFFAKVTKQRKTRANGTVVICKADRSPTVRIK